MKIKTKAFDKDGKPIEADLGIGIGFTPENTEKKDGVTIIKKAKLNHVALIGDDEDSKDDQNSR